MDGCRSPLTSTMNPSKFDIEMILTPFLYDGLDLTSLGVTTWPRLAPATIPLFAGFTAIVSTGGASV